MPTLLDRSSCTSGVALTCTCPQTSPQPSRSPRAGSWHQYPPQNWIWHSQSHVCVLGQHLVMPPACFPHEPLQVLQKLC